MVHVVKIKISCIDHYERAKLIQDCKKMIIEAKQKDKIFYKKFKSGELRAGAFPRVMANPHKKLRYSRE
jgi:hypothetical protein